MNSASPCSLAGRYDNPIRPRFLAPIDSLKIPAQELALGYCFHQFTGQQLLRRTFMLISGMKKEDWRRREEYFLGVDLEDVKDL